MASIKTIRRHLQNPNLLNNRVSLDSKPSEALNRGENTVWRNAYYLSTSIEEANMRGMASANVEPPKEEPSVAKIGVMPPPPPLGMELDFQDSYQ